MGEDANDPSPAADHLVVAFHRIGGAQLVAHVVATQQVDGSINGLITADEARVRRGEVRQFGDQLGCGLGGDRWAPAELTDVIPKLVAEAQPNSTMAS